MLPGQPSGPVAQGHAANAAAPRGSSDSLTASPTGYGWLLDLALRGRWAVALAFVAVLGLAFFTMGRVGGEFLPPIDDGRIMVKVMMPTGSSVQETDRVLRQIEQRIADDPLIESTFAIAGGQVMGLYTYEVANQGQTSLGRMFTCRRPRSIIGQMPRA
jgi:multidrug efflux pump subunit AcrB